VPSDPPKGAPTPTATVDFCRRLAGEKAGLGRELLLTHLGIFVTLLAASMVMRSLVLGSVSDISLGRVGLLLQRILLAVIVMCLVWGNLVYQWARLGCLRRRRSHRRATRRELNSLYTGQAKPLAVLVPAYREEIDVVRQTLWSAALQDYPNRQVVLLIDDPPEPTTDAGRDALFAARELSKQINEMLAGPARQFAAELEAFEARRGTGLDVAEELRRLSGLYEQVAEWHDSQKQAEGSGGHVSRLFVWLVFERPARRHGTWSRTLAGQARHGAGRWDEDALACEYRRLAALFDVQVTSFERKRWQNLSHAPNKAMNLNSYISLLGKSFRVVKCEDGLHCQPVEPAAADFHVPPADYLLTLDADSLIAPQYASRLVHVMERPGFERVGVAQTPYSAVPGPPGVLERVASATTDAQYVIHQGFTACHATSWVGANALLRREALEDIAETSEERGYRVQRFIQDRTVIEDSESSVDLIDRGWLLYNYPERLAYSATPPDFGALLIQRRRWSNGGLIIIPKLLRYLRSNHRRPGIFAESFMRVHYLMSNAMVNVALLVALAFPFSDGLLSWWMPLTALPYFYLYARDLVRIGYRRMDVFRVYAMNLMLIPICLGGSYRSLRQAWTKRKVPFARTPKILGRTTAPGRYVFAVLLLAANWLAAGAWDAADTRYMHAAFAVTNALIMLYAVTVYMGWRAVWQDLRLGWAALVARRREARDLRARARRDQAARSPEPVA
jgi:cellulose synthase/poly-beta-1,6-N-acetylglucosamine synthase-like glycosyltransferase